MGRTARAIEPTDPCPASGPEEGGRPPVRGSTIKRPAGRREEFREIVGRDQLVGQGRFQLQPAGAQPAQHLRRALVLLLGGIRMGVAIGRRVDDDLEALAGGRMRRIPRAVVERAEVDSRSQPARSPPDIRKLGGIVTGKEDVVMVRGGSPAPYPSPARPSRTGTGLSGGTALTAFWLPGRTFRRRGRRGRRCR